jgi:hypothetical protein
VSPTATFAVGWMTSHALLKRSATVGTSHAIFPATLVQPVGVSAVALSDSPLGRS